MTNVLKKQCYLVVANMARMWCSESADKMPFWVLWLWMMVATGMYWVHEHMYDEHDSKTTLEIWARFTGIEAIMWKDVFMLSSKHLLGYHKLLSVCKQNVSDFQVSPSYHADILAQLLGLLLAAEDGTSLGSKRKEILMRVMSFAALSKDSDYFWPLIEAHTMTRINNRNPKEARQGINTVLKGRSKDVSSILDVSKSASTGKRIAIVLMCIMLFNSRNFSLFDRAKPSRVPRTDAAS